MTHWPISRAVLSDCGRYRYTLTREMVSLPEDRRALLIVMLNPSIADASINDPTIVRCMGFARAHGYNALTVVNLFAYRATKPADLWSVESDALRIGPRNDEHINEELSRHGAVLLAWGAHASRCEERAKLIRGRAIGYGNRCIFSLGATKAGHPRHPLMVRTDQPMLRIA